ncbi:MAG: type 4 pilus major pilin [Alphaproteobacteria bacterium]
MTLQRRRSAKGFNLIEAAIVLGIVGLVVGGIWVAATSVYTNMRAKRATEQLLSIAQNVRALYATSATTGLANAATMTIALKQANIFPNDMILGTTVNDIGNPWSGRVAVYSQAPGGSQGDGFEVVFSQVPSAACADFIIRNTGQGRDVALAGVGVGASTATGTEPTTTATNWTSFPQLVTDVTTACNATAATNANVSFRFRFR